MTKNIKSTRFWAIASKGGNKALGYAGRLGNQKHLTVMRDAFALFMPLIIAGAAAVLLRTFVFGAAGATQTSILGWIGMATGDSIKDASGNWSFLPGSAIANISSVGNFLFYGVSRATFDLISIYVAFSLGFLFTKARGSDAPLIGGLLATASFFVATLGNISLFDAKGIATAIIITFVSTEIFCWLTASGKMQIKMPEGVPPAVARAFAKLFPVMIVLFVIMLLNVPFILFGFFTKMPPEFSAEPLTWTIGDGIFCGMQGPFIDFASTEKGGLGLGLAFTTGIAVLWFFGLHGSNILVGIFEPIFLVLYTANTKGAHNIFVKSTFDAFTFVGGAGAIMGLVLALLLFSKAKEEKMISKLSFGPSIFNINEPMLFGMPMILNLRYAIPFITTQPILTITTFLGFTWFKVHTVTIMIPWTTPFPIGGLLATAFDWKGLVLASINFVLAFLLYLPWVLFWTKKDALKSSKASKVEEAKVEVTVAKTTPAAKKAPAKKTTVKTVVAKGAQ